MKHARLLFCFVVLAVCEVTGLRAAAGEPVTIGNRRELFVDDFLVERLVGRAVLQMKHPVPAEVVLETSEPWEGNGTNYVTVFQEAGKYRMYYRGTHYSYLKGKDRPNHRDVYCYAESADGIHWTKPQLGLFDWDGSKKNNIVIDGTGRHAFAPFRDSNPTCAPDAIYKAIGWSGPEKGLYAFKSADGVRWSLMSPDPVITEGAFDSLNLAFWDATKGEYRSYHRDFRNDGATDLILSGIDRGRDIKTSHSSDFVHWAKPEFLSYTANVELGRPQAAGAQGKLPEGYPAGRVSELYTNQIMPYYRAPHLLLGFPTRYTDRGWTESAKLLPRPDYRVVRATSPEDKRPEGSRREGTAVTDGMFMTSRDRSHFSIWPESFLRPGLRTHDTWFYGDMYQNWGMVETRSAIQDAPPEISIYVTERTLQETGAAIRRYTLRIDGFASLHAPLVGGELVTKPVIFGGDKLAVNFSTSAVGSVRIKLQDAEGRPLPGFSLEECHEIYGDDLERTVGWQKLPSLASLAGRPVRLRFALKAADLYSFQFVKGPP